MNRRKYVVVLEFAKRQPTTPQIVLANSMSEALQIVEGSLFKQRVIQGAGKHFPRSATVSRVR